MIEGASWSSASMQKLNVFGDKLVIYGHVDSYSRN